MKLSVIIPVYNVEKYLARCLDSVLAASERLHREKGNWSVEIICVNDGSTDGSAGVLARYASRVRILTKANGGLGSARNAGLDAMTGDYVTFVDSDDWIPERALFVFADVAEKSGAALVVADAFAKSSEAPLRLPEPQAACWALRPTAWIVGRKVQYSACNKLYRADLFKSRRYPATLYEDFPVTTALFAEVGSFAVVHEPLYVYCVREEGASIVHSAFTERKMRDSLTVVRMVMEERRGGARDGFLLHQAADGLSSTVGQVYKHGDKALSAQFVTRTDGLFRAFPELKGKMSLKARWRYWRLRGERT